MILTETYTLTNGVKIPKLGLGTWLLDDTQASEATRQAIQLGYRLIDTAQAYGNEAGVGEGVRTCGVPRTDLFIASKVAAEHKTYDSAAASIDGTLQKMGLEYLDLMIIHSPQPWKAVNQSADRYEEGNREAWRALEDAYKEGKLRAIGVSNFIESDIENILAGCRIQPMVNQILTHITNTNFGLIDYCQRHGIRVEAYSPIAHGEALKNDKIAAMAKKCQVSPAQLCLRYDLQLGAVVLPKTANPAHMQTNAELDFVIADADMDELKALPHIESYGADSHFPVFGGKL